MELVFTLLLLVSILEVAVLSFCARVNPLDLKGMALHPYNILGFLFFIVDIDFQSLFQLVQDGDKVYFAGTMISSVDTVSKGFIFYLLCQSFITAGVVTVAMVSSKTFSREYFVLPGEITASRICMALCVVGTVFGAWALIEVSLSRGSFTYIAGVRTRFFAANPLLLIIVSTIAPSYILFGSRSGLRAAAFCLIPLLPFLALVGGRSKLLYPLIAFAYWICLRVRWSALLIYIGAPILLLALSLFTFVSLQGGDLLSFPKFLQESGGLTGSLFDEASISMAEVISINVARPIVHRQPWESLVGGVMLPIPRSAVPFKPEGASTQFTEMADPERWEAVKSEWTVTGFINLLFDFRTPGALGMCAVLGALWAWMLQLAFRSRVGTRLVGPICCLVAYQFIRGDLYIVAQFLWPVLVVLVVYWVLALVLRPVFGRNARTRVFGGPAEADQWVSHPFSESRDA